MAGISMKRNHFEQSGHTHVCTRLINKDGVVFVISSKPDNQIAVKSQLVLHA